MEQPWEYLPPSSPEQAEKKRVRRSANFVGAVLLAMLGVQLLIGLVLRALISFGVLRGTNDFGLGNIGYCLLNMLLYVLFLPVPTLAVAGIARSRINPFPVRRVRPWALLALLAAGMAMAVLSNIIASYFMRFVNSFGVPVPDMPDSIQPSLTSLVLNIISTAILPGLIEELIFRVYIMGALRPHGNATALWVSAFLFGLFHGNILQFPFAFLLGLVLGWLTIQTESILPAVILHFGNNLMSVLLSYFGKINVEFTESALLAITFVIIAAAGVVSLSVLLITDRRGGTGRQDLLRPIGNGASPLTAGKRFGFIVSAPAMVVALILMTIELLSSMLRS